MPAAAKAPSKSVRAVFLRMPPEVYKKLQRLTAVHLARGKRATIQDTVIDLIVKAKDAK